MCLCKCAVDVDYDSGQNVDLLSRWIRQKEYLKGDLRKSFDGRAIAVLAVLVLHMQSIKYFIIYKVIKYRKKID